MNLGTGNRKQTMMAGVLGLLALVACIYIYEEVFAGGSPAPEAPAPAMAVPVGPARTSAAASPAAVGGNSAKAVGSSAALDPTLHMEAMLVSESVVYSGSGRNIFSPNSAPPVVIPKPVAPARIQALAHAGPPPPPPGPPPPPPIDLKFFGFETSAAGQRQAFLLHNDDVFLASAGDVVLRRYRVIAIDAKTIQVEDMQNNNKQTLPLVAN